MATCQEDLVAAVDIYWYFFEDDEEESRERLSVHRVRGSINRQNLSYWMALTLSRFPTQFDKKQRTQYFQTISFKRDFSSKL